MWVLSIRRACAIKSFCYFFQTWPLKRLSETLTFLMKILQQFREEMTRA